MIGFAKFFNIITHTKEEPIRLLYVSTFYSLFICPLLGLIFRFYRSKQIYIIIVVNQNQTIEYIKVFIDVYCFFSLHIWAKLFLEYDNVNI